MPPRSAMFSPRVSLPLSFTSSTAVVAVVLLAPRRRPGGRTPARRPASTSRAGCPGRRTAAPRRRSRGSARGPSPCRWRRSSPRRAPPRTKKGGCRMPAGKTISLSARVVVGVHDGRRHLPLARGRPACRSWRAAGSPRRRRLPARCGRTRPGPPAGRRSRASVRVADLVHQRARASRGRPARVGPSIQVERVEVPPHGRLDPGDDLPRPGSCPPRRSVRRTKAWPSASPRAPLGGPDAVLPARLELLGAGEVPCS